MNAVKRLIAKALEEDIGGEDITTTRTVPVDLRCRARLMAKQDGVLSGIEVFRMVFDRLNPQMTEWNALPDGERFHNGDDIATFEGNARAILTAERTAMNFLQHLSGVATYTARFVAAVEGMNVRICDTRKTTPLMRQLEKKAVVHGGGTNHRHTLFNGVLIKENHITAAGGIRNAVKSVLQGAHHLMKIEVEVTDLDEFEEALEAGADVIMLDNMSTDTMGEAVRRAEGRRVILEASGNASLENVRALAATGVHLISVGALTHSAPSADLSLIIESV